MVKDYFGYKGKRVVVTGAASGMGEAATKMLVDLGAEIYALDIREVTLPVKKYISTNLLKKESIDAAVAKLPAKIDCIFSCAGVAGPTYRGSSFSPVDVVTINFLAARHLIEKLLPRMGGGSAISMISSVGGMGWQANMPTVMKLLETNGFDKGRAWLEANKDDPQAIGGPPENGRPYCFSKECLILYAKLRAYELAAKNMRINTLSPGNTTTAMTPDFDAIYGKENTSAVLSPIGRNATPEEQAQPLVFLNSDMASYISGLDLQVDYGFAGMVSTGGAALPVPGK